MSDRKPGFVYIPKWVISGAMLVLTMFLAMPFLLGIAFIALVVREYGFDLDPVSRVDAVESAAVFTLGTLIYGASFFGGLFLFVSRSKWKEENPRKVGAVTAILLFTMIALVPVMIFAAYFFGFAVSGTGTIG